MNKTQRMRKATYKTKNKTFWYWCKQIILFPWRVIKAIWRFICRVCSAIWNWLKSIDVVGMINLTLLLVIIILFSALIINFVRCSRCPSFNSGNDNNSVVAVAKQKPDNRKVVKRTFNTTLPLKADKKTNITPKIRTVGVAKPEVIKEISVPGDELPQQTLNGDVIVDVQTISPVLSNGTKINGNLIIQNMRKYTLPCGTKINGHLFVRNVSKLYFCGEFTVNGNIYVNRESSFGPLPKGAKVNGQIIL